MKQTHPSLTSVLPSPLQWRAPSCQIQWSTLSPVLVFHSTPKPFVPAVPAASDPRSHAYLPAPCSPRIRLCRKSTYKNVTLDFPSLLTYLPNSPVSEQPAPPPSGSHYRVKMSPVILSLRRVGRVAPWVLFSHSSNSYLGNCTTRLILLLCSRSTSLTGRHYQKYSLGFAPSSTAVSK